MSAGVPKLIRSRTFQIDDKAEAKGKRTFRVRCSDRLADDADTAIIAVVGAGYGIGSSWSTGQPGLVVVSIGVDEQEDAPADGGTTYEVTLDYSTKATEKDQQEEDPTARPMMIRLGFDSTEETIYEAKDAQPTAVDADGNPVTIGADKWLWGKSIVNSAGQPFDSQISEVTRDPVITVTKNVDTTDFPKIWKLLADTVNTVNVSAFDITYRGVTLKVDAKTSYLADCTSEPKVETIKSTGVEKQYEEVSLTFKLRKDGWKRKILDRGKAQFQGNDVTKAHPPEPIRDANGDPVTEAVLLDGKGSRLKESTKPVFLVFRSKELGGHGNLLRALGA